VPATFDPFGDGTVFDRSVSCGDMGDAQLDTGDSSLSWFSAGLRVGLGIGFGVCLGAGIGVGILLNGYRGAHARAHRLKNVVFG
jgi:F0F1-type ATP synthase membrane subunit c/vacuolar-type H+-ATPase subunit K